MPLACPCLAQTAGWQGTCPALWCVRAALGAVWGLRILRAGCAVTGEAGQLDHSPQGTYQPRAASPCLPLGCSGPQQGHACPGKTSPSSLVLLLKRQIIPVFQESNCLFLRLCPGCQKVCIFEEDGHAPVFKTYVFSGCQRALAYAGRLSRGWRVWPRHCPRRRPDRAHWEKCPGGRGRAGEPTAGALGRRGRSPLGAWGKDGGNKFRVLIWNSGPR